jgi:hypothetical protein
MVIAMNLSILLFKKKGGGYYYLLFINKIVQNWWALCKGCMKRKTPPLTYPPTHSTPLGQYLTSTKESFNSLSQAKPWGW